METVLKQTAAGVKVKADRRAGFLPISSIPLDRLSR